MNASYVPGDHVVAVTGRAVVMTGPDHLAEVSALVDGESTPLGVISTLSGGDLTRLPEFAAAVLDGTDLVVLVRGPYAVRTGSQEWTGRDVATWREHRVPAGDEVVVAHEKAGDDRGLPLVAGAVLASRVAWHPTASPDAPAADDERGTSAAQDPDVTVLEVEDGATTGTVTDAGPGDDGGDQPDAGEAAEGFDETIGATIQGQRVPAPEPASRPAPEPGPAPADGDHDGRTITAEQMRELRARTGTGAPTTTSSVSATLTVSGGETVELTKPVLIGRSPRAAHKTGAQLPRMMVVDDPYVSGTHLEVGVRDGDVVAIDRSTNGTALTRPGGEPERLPKDEPTVIGDGCVLRLSDDLTVTVTVTGTAG